jgi:predicted aspartyl protease
MAMRAGALATIVVVAHLAGCPSAPWPPPLHGIGDAVITRNLLLLEVPVAIDGRGYAFIVDTGSSVTSLTAQTAAATAFRTEGRTTVNGRHPASTGTIARFEVAGLEVRDLPVAVISLPLANKLTLGYAGILGLDVLGRYDTALDLHRQRLVVMPAGAAKRQVSDALAKLPIRYTRDGLVIVDVSIAGRTVPAVLDTGATQSVISPQTLPDRDAAVIADNLHLGNAELGLQSFVVAEHLVFARSGLAGRPAVLLGVDVLVDRQLVLAYQDRMLYVSR